MFRNLITLIALFFMISCTEARDMVETVEVEQSKDEITAELGRPNEINIYPKSNEYIWGPEESFWSEIPMGTKLEVWRYQDKSGQLNLYFLSEGSSLSYKAFAPAGVVYESSK